MRRLTMWIGLGAVLGLMLGTGQAWAQAVPAVPVSVPEPGPLIGAGVVTLMGLGYAWLRRKRHRGVVRQGRRRGIRPTGP